MLTAQYKKETEWYGCVALCPYQTKNVWKQWRENTRLRPKRYTNLDNANASDRRLALSATLNTWQKQIITIILSKKRKHLPEPSAIQGGADLRFYGSQPGTRQSCETTDTEPVCHTVCLFTPQLMHVSNYTAWWPKTKCEWMTCSSSSSSSSSTLQSRYNAHR